MEKVICVSLVIILTCVELSAGYICKGFNCEADECSKDNICSIGCVDGFYSDDRGQCAPECPDTCTGCIDFQCISCFYGYYGDNCTLSCEGCRDGQCDLTNGQCINGCKEGFEGEPWCNVTIISVNKQTKLSSLDADENARKIYIWIASLLISAVILVVLAVIVFISLERKRGWKSYDVKFEQTGYQPTQTVEERIEMDEV